MRHLRFYGASDDLIEIEGDVPGCDEFNAEKAIFEVAGLRIAFEYAGTWEIAVAQVDESVPVRVEDMRLSVAENGYSMQLDMDVPDDAYVTRVAVDA